MRVPGVLSGRAGTIVFDQRCIDCLRKRTVVGPHTSRAGVQPNLDKTQRICLVQIILAVADTTAGSLMENSSEVACKYTRPGETNAAHLP